MSLTHNAEADFAASELARMFVADAGLCYAASARPAALSASASYEPSSSPWPHADGVVALLESGTNATREIAIEYKRVQEGAHGLLTAIGQAQGYVHKGYHGAAIVVPSLYSSLSGPAEYVRNVLDAVTQNPSIGVFRYDTPDTSSSAPFNGRLHCVRPFTVATQAIPARRAMSRPKTQWVHMREGSTTRDGFYRFLQAAKMLSGAPDPVPRLPQELRDAVSRIAPGRSAEYYLSSTTDDKFLSRVWRAFWFEWILTPEVLRPWIRTGAIYAPPGAFTRIRKDDDSGFSQIFEGRSGSLKWTMVEGLNNGSLSENDAWEGFAKGLSQAVGQNKQGIADRAHSYREDMDSALSQLGWIDADGRPTDSGYRYTNICERYGGANSAAATDYLGATLLKAGHYASFLHYVYRLSEECFSTDPLAFTNVVRGRPVFNEASYTEYLAYLEAKLSDDLKVMRKVSTRGRPRRRTPFQVELTLLRNYGFVSNARYRLGVGIPVDWEKVLSSLNIEL